MHRSISCTGSPFWRGELKTYRPFSVRTISPAGQVAARVAHPEGHESEAERIRNPEPDWSGTATESTLVLTMDPLPPGALASAGVKDAAGHIEAHRKGDHYGVEFTYFYAWSSPQAGDCKETDSFWGEMKHL